MCLLSHTGRDNNLLPLGCIIHLQHNITFYNEKSRALSMKHGMGQVPPKASSLRSCLPSYARQIEYHLIGHSILHNISHRPSCNLLDHSCPSLQSRPSLLTTNPKDKLSFVLIHIQSYPSCQDALRESNKPSYYNHSRHIILRRDDHVSIEELK